MTHEEMRDRLLDLAYGELSPRDAREVEAHAASCEACAAELARIRGTRALMSGLPEEPAPAGGERILLAAAREAARRRAPPRSAARWLWAASLAAASLAVVAVSYRLLAFRPGPIAREDPQALMGDSPYAREPRDAAQAGAAQGQGEASAPGEERGATLGQAPEAHAVAKGDAEATRRAPARRAAPSRRFAEPPPPEAPAAAPTRPEPAPPPPSPSPSPYAAAPRAAERPGPAAEAAEPPPAAAAAGPERSRAEDREATSAPQGTMSAEAAPPRAAAAPPAGRAKAAAPAAVLRNDDLRRAGRLRGEVRTFPGCDGEQWRKVERDPDGRVVSYAREGLLGDRRVRVDVVYGPDGEPERVTVKDAATSAPVPAAGAWIPTAAEAEGPPRCGR